VKEIGMRLLVLGILLAALAWAGVAEAQTTISVDITKARLTWQWAQGAGGAVAEFRVKCGTSTPTTGTATKVTVLPDPAARQAPVLSVITGVGTWFCAVAAANQFGESPLSNVVTFDAGTVPVAPTALQIEAE
jgi:hypothetical protein